MEFIKILRPVANRIVERSIYQLQPTHDEDSSTPMAHLRHGLLQENLCSLII